MHIRTSIHASRVRLQVKSKELEEKNALANAKLKQMVADQQAAESKKTEGEALQVKLKEMSEYISVKRADVMHQLAAVEPAVEDAKQGQFKSRYFAQFQVRKELFFKTSY